MSQIFERIEALGGQRFIRDYQPSWEASLRAGGLRLAGQRIPTFPAIAETPLSAQRIAGLLLPHLMLALQRVLRYALASPERRAILLGSLLNRQELLFLDINRPPRLGSLFGRFDTFLRRENGVVIPTVIEANFNNVEGALFHHVTGRGGERLVDALGLAQSWRFPSVLWSFWRWMLERYRSQVAGPPIPTVGIVWHSGHRVKDVELPIAAEHFRRWGWEQGIRVLIGDWRDIDHTPRRGWTLNGVPLHILWKNVGPFYPQGLIDAPYGRLIRQDPDHICVVSDVVGRLLGCKWLLAALWEPSHRFLFSNAQWLAISLMAPWAAQIRDGPAQGPDAEVIPDLLRFLSDYKDDWVIKPILGSHGEGVFVGIDTPQAVWDDALGKACDGRWIAMRYARPEEVTLPIVNPAQNWEMTWRTFYADCNFYVLGNRCGPVIRRASSQRILNVAREAADGSPGGGLLIAATRVCALHAEQNTARANTVFSVQRTSPTNQLTN